MATAKITVSELRCAVLDSDWRRRWIRGEKPSSLLLASDAGIKVHGQVFHKLAEDFVDRLVSTQGADAAFKLTTGEQLWAKLWDSLAQAKVDQLMSAGHSLDSVHALVERLKSFCHRLAELRQRTPQFQGWSDLFLSQEAEVKNAKFVFAAGTLLICGRLDAVRTHPQYGLEIVDYKLTRGSHLKHDLLQLAIYARLLKMTKPGLQFHGTLEYYTPMVHEVPVKPEELETIFAEVVAPVLPELLVLPTPQTKTPKDKKASPDLSTKIKECFATYSLTVDVIGRQEAPQLVRYLVKPAQGVKVISLANRADDLLVHLGLPQAPLVEPGPGHVSIDIPKIKPDRVFWREVIEDPALKGHSSRLAFPVGINVHNQLLLADLADANTCHVLVAGTSGSGKSEFLKAMIASLMLRNDPSTLRLTLVDPKLVTFHQFKDNPFLGGPIITDINAVVSMLHSAVQEMERRYRILAAEGVENLLGLHRRGRTDIPFHVLVFDEFMDLLLSSKESKKEFEDLVARLASKGRAAGLHLVLATQRPDSKVVTGLIKANLPLKVCLRVVSSKNSQIILDQTGGQALMGNGDLLCDRGYGAERAQGVYVEQEDIKMLMDRRGN